ncbi:MAG TPA: hypothetical protein VGH37_03335, partial [Candidatus Acidoferrum sp.]
QETKIINGVYGLATLPGIGYLFGGRNNTAQDTELLVLVTPRRVREQNRVSKTIYAGTGDTGGRGAIGGNAPLAPQPIPEPPPEQQPVGQPPVNQPQPNEPSQPPPQQPAPQEPPNNPQPEPDTSQPPPP